MKNSEEGAAGGPQNEGGVGGLEDGAIGGVEAGAQRDKVRELGYGCRNWAGEDDDKELEEEGLHACIASVEQGATPL